MKTICLLAEGSYPYIAGGVSSWINQLISELPDFKFKIISIMPSDEEFNEYRYEIPKNVISIDTIYLQDFKKLSATPKEKKIKLSKDELITLKKFIRFDPSIDWKIFANLIRNIEKIGTIIDFLKSKLFWDLIVEYYKDEFPEEGFNEFYWTVSSMFLFFITVMQHNLPKADIYHAVSTGYPGLLGLIASQSYNKKFILTEHGIYAREREEDIIKAEWVRKKYKKLWIDFFYFISIGAYKNADITISLFSANRNIQLKYGSKEETTIVIPNGVDLKRYNTEKIEHKGFNIGAVVRVVPIKDIKTLIRSFKIVINKLEANDIKLYIMGPYEEDPEYYKECLDLVKFLELEDFVIFTGRINVSEYLKKMDLLVLSSISEAQPLVILEGFASGIPFVSTDVGACKELLYGNEEDNLGQAGIIVPPFSPKEMSEAIIKLYKDRNLLNKMGKIGRKRIEKYYTKESFIKQYRDLYMKIGD